MSVEYDVQRDSVSFILCNAKIALKNITLVRRPYFCRSDATDGPEGAVQQVADKMSQYFKIDSSDDSPWSGGFDTV